MDEDIERLEKQAEWRGKVSAVLEIIGVAVKEQTAALKELEANFRKCLEDQRDLYESKLAELSKTVDANQAKTNSRINSIYLKVALLGLTVSGAGSAIVWYLINYVFPHVGNK